MTTYQLTKTQAKQYAEGYNLYVARHNAGEPSLPRSPKGAWIARGYEDVRRQMLARQLKAGNTTSDIMAPFEPITAETAQLAWDAAEARTQAAMNAHKAQVNAL